jgi:protein-arginine deiminase
LPDESIIRIPSLMAYSSVHPTPEQAFAFMPGMVNMLVITNVNNVAAVPDPLGPRNTNGDVFKTCATEALSGVLSVEFQDGWRYHVGTGEVHCATNTKRIPPNDKAWWNNW